MTLAIKELDFEAEVLDSKLRLRGNANGKHAEDLEQLVSRTHTLLFKTRAARFEVDMRELEFMTASCFNVFVTWVSMISALPAAQRYRLEFAINPEQGWQRRSLVTLSSVAGDVVTFT